MIEERRKVLEMLSEGKISVTEADKLLAALGEGENGASERAGEGGLSGFKYLRVLVEPEPGNSDGERVNIRIPIKLIRAGLKLAALIPQNAQTKVNEALKEKGIEFDLNQFSAQDLEELVSNLDDLQVEVEGKETVRVFCE